MPENENIDLKCINTIRTLSMDAVQASNSGHPGTPMALALVFLVLLMKRSVAEKGERIGAE